jgi:hypothetical protein
LRQVLEHVPRDDDVENVCWQTLLGASASNCRSTGSDWNRGERVASGGDVPAIDKSSHEAAVAGTDLVNPGRRRNLPQEADLLGDRDLPQRLEREVGKPRRRGVDAAAVERCLV